MSPTTTLPSAQPHPLFPSATAHLIPTSTHPPVSIYTLTFGTGPPLLLLHGFPQTLAIWNKVAPELSKRFTLVICDLRGYGRSSKPRASTASSASTPFASDKGDDSVDPTPDWVLDEQTSHALYSKRSMALDMIHVMSALGHEKFHILSHDRGARLAHSLVMNHAASALSVIFLDIVPTLAAFRATGPTLAAAYYHWFFLQQPAPFPEDAILAAPLTFAKKSLLGLGTKAVKVEEGDYGIFGKEAWEDYLAGFSDEETVHGWCEDYRAGAKEDCGEQMGQESRGERIRCPVGVAWGEKGVLPKVWATKVEWEKVSEEGGVRLARGLPSGHYIPEECPEGVLGFCEEFYTGLGLEW